MSDIALQIEKSTTGSVGVGSNVVFDTTVYSAGNISYNNATGVITFNEAGRYVLIGGCNSVSTINKWCSICTFIISR